VDTFQFGKNCITIETSQENLCFSVGVLSNVTCIIWTQVIIICLLVVEVYVELRDMLRYLVCFCDMTSSRLVDSYQYFEGTCCTHLEVSYPVKVKVASSCVNQIVTVSQWTSIVLRSSGTSNSRTLLVLLVSDTSII
jgi:hypothetical protein